MQLNGIYQDSTTQVGDPWVWDGIIRSALKGQRCQQMQPCHLSLNQLGTMEISSQLDEDIEMSPIIRWVIGLVSRIFMEAFQVWDITCFSGRCFVWMMRLLMAKGHKSEWQHVATFSFTSLSIRQGNSLPDMTHSRCAPDQTLQGSITDGMHSLCFGHPKRLCELRIVWRFNPSGNVKPKTPFICPHILRETCKASASCQRKNVKILHVQLFPQSQQARPGLPQNQRMAEPDAWRSCLRKHLSKLIENMGTIYYLGFS